MAAICLQAQAGCPVTFSRTAKTVQPGVFQIVVEYSEEAVGRLALQLAEQLCLAARADTPFDLQEALRRLRDLDEEVRLGPSTGSIVYAGVARGIPCRRLSDGSLVQFGWGRKQRRIQAAEIDSTSAIAESIAQDKQLTKDLLHASGVPVPTGRPVLVTPHIGVSASPGKNILLCWNASREAARAASDAMPFLTAAEKVIVLAIDAKPSAKGHGAEPGADVAAWLARHGARVTVQRDTAVDSDVGNLIVSRAADFASDMIVMGVYGHSRMREVVLGGASRTLLASLTVPALIAH